MTKKEFLNAIAENKELVMAKYKCFGEYSKFKPVSKEVALQKIRVRVNGGYCPYIFKIVKK